MLSRRAPPVPWQCHEREGRDVAIRTQDGDNAAFIMDWLTIHGDDGVPNGKTGLLLQGSESDPS